MTCPRDMPQTVVVMGVSASGKTTISNQLGVALGYRVLDADDLHPASNVEKMRRSIALTDADRLPWLQQVAAWIQAQRALGTAVVVSCSALKRNYRDVLRQADRDAAFVLLEVDPDTLKARLQHRPGHFMPASLLQSQLDELEPPAADERAVRVLSQGNVQATVAAVLTGLSTLR